MNNSENKNNPSNNPFVPKIPILDLEEQADMLFEFTAESLNLLIDAKNAVMTLEAVSNNSEAVSNAFKVFYTIKGLAGFLNLSDIKLLATKGEELFDSLRKDLLVVDSNVIDAAMETIDNMRQLLDLLNEQISNGGELKKPYLNIGPTINNLLKLRERTVSKEIKKVINDKKEGKIPSVSLPVFNNDSRAKILKRQQELIKERELAMKLSQQAQAAAAEKGEMLASMSHEMRTLISAILGFSDLLMKSQLEDKQKEFLSSIHSSGEFLLEIINNILDLEKVERGKLHLEKVSFNLESLIAHSFQIIRTRIEGKSILLSFDINPDIPLNLLGDPTRLRQILINLLNNAAKFTEKGEISLSVDFNKENKDEKNSEDSAKLLFIISDTGIGISKSRKKLIFEPFTQGDKAITREYGGTGLGLTISRSYVEVMGGKIWLESEIEKGSQFMFTMNFPIDRATNAASKNMVDASFDSVKNKRVALIDSDPRKTLKSFFRNLNITVDDEFTGNAKEIFDQLKKCSEEQKQPDLILIDLLSNKEQGYLLASKIREEKSFENVKMVAITSDIKIAFDNEAYTQYFSDFLLRPIMNTEFLSMIRKIFAVPAPKDDKIDKIKKNDGCKGAHILVVDDSPINMELIQAYFESIGCIGDYAANGQEAIEKVKSREYDICFMDLQMPIMNGFVAAQIIRQEISKDLPIVALTAADEEEDRERCKKIGFNDFLTKPFNMEDFKDKIILYGRR